MHASLMTFPRAHARVYMGVCMNEIHFCTQEPYMYTRKRYPRLYSPCYKIENIQPNTKLCDGLFIRVSERCAAGTRVYGWLFSRQAFSFHFLRYNIQPRWNDDYQPTGLISINANIRDAKRLHLNITVRAATGRCRHCCQEFGVCMYTHEK